MNKKHVFWILGILGVALYFFLRLYHILSLPIFTDEAIYIRWSQIAKQDASWRFISLTDGKQPMFIWVAMIFLKFIHDPLLASRLVSVVTGFLTMVGLYFLGSETFKNKWVGLISALFYVIYPFGVVYDRMALYDSMVGMFAVWALYFEVLLIRKNSLGLAMSTGLVTGGAVLTKTSGFFGIYLLPLSLLLFNFSGKSSKKEFFRWCFHAVVVIGLTYLYYSVLRLSPFFHIINDKNAIFVYPLREWLQHPLEFFISNWKGQINWLSLYMTIPVLLLVIGSFFTGLNNLREKILLFLWFFVPFVALALFGRTIYPRFILFMTLPLIPLMATSIVRIYELIKNKIVFFIVLLLFFAMSLWATYMVITDFVHAPVPSSDVKQYGVDWPAGGGVKESIQLFENESKQQKIYVATEGTFGLLPYALEMYLESNPNIKIQGYWPIDDNVHLDLLKISQKIKTFIVFYQPCPPCPYIGGAPVAWNLKPVLTYKKPIVSRYLTVYQVGP